MNRILKSKAFKIVAVLLVVVLFSSVLIVAAGNGIFSGRDKPPRFRADEEQKGPSFNNTAEGKIIINDKKREFLLGYLDNFKTESADGVADETEVMRISRKNALINEYREYVNKLYNTEMTETVYESHYEYLMVIFKELLTLEPEKSFNEKTVIYIKRIIVTLEDFSAISKGENGEKFAKGNNFNLERADEALVALQTLKHKILNGIATKDEIKEEYSLCFEKFKAATSVNCALMLKNELIVESLPD